MLSRFYGRNLEQKGEDLHALPRLPSEVSAERASRACVRTDPQSLVKTRLSGPFPDPRLMIRSALDPAQIMSSRDGARVPLCARTR